MGKVYVSSWNNITISDDKQEEYIRKCEEYEKYIDEHRKNVVRAYLELFVNKDYGTRYGDIVFQILGKDEELVIPKNIWKQSWMSIANDIVRHDISKYDDEEFYPYRRKYYPMDGEIQDEEEFEKAWKHHYQSNNHHVEYWKDAQAKEIPFHVILHMICDWASFDITNDVNGKTIINWKSLLNWWNNDAWSDCRPLLKDLQAEEKVGTILIGLMEYRRGDTEDIFE